MSPDALRFYFNAIESRKDAEMAIRSRLPGWRLYARAAMRRVVRNKRRYFEALRSSK